MTELKKLACIILAAGQGTRMRSAMPKVMHLLTGLPMITHVRRALESLGPQQIVAVISPDAKSVADSLAPHAIAYQEKRLGTAHAVLAARDALKNFKGRVLIAYGDTPLIRSETLRALANHAAPVTVLAFNPADPAQYGRVFVNAEGQVERIIEFADASPSERASPLCNAGLMAFNSDVLWELLSGIQPHNAQGEFYLTDAIALAHAQGILCGHIVAKEDEVMGVNSRAELAAAERVMQDRLRAAAMEKGATLRDPSTVYFSTDTELARDVIVGPNVVFGPGVKVEEGAEILPFSHLEGVVVGAGARIGPFARLRPDSKIGAGAHIGNFVEVKKSDVAAGAKINHLSYVGDAKVGARTNIGAGTITANYDGTHKHATEIGADVSIGSDTVLVAPVKVGEGALIAAGSIITDDVPAQAMAIAREKQVNKADWAKRYRDKKAK